MTVAYIRRTGPYAVSAKAAWSEVFAIFDRAGIRDQAGSGYGLLHDDPRVTEAEALRYDACVELTPELAPHTPQFATQTLPGGPYLRQCYKGATTGIGDAMSRLFREEASERSLRIDPRRPLLEIYPTDPRTLVPDAIKVELCVPVAI